MSHHCPFCELIFANRAEVEEHVQLDHTADEVPAEPAPEAMVSEADVDPDPREPPPETEAEGRRGWFRRRKS
ncbi:MAG TPA: hypothetical protein VGA13_06615 [Acidimicrobiales bacterium]|jgi:hypothetical protein